MTTNEQPEFNSINNSTGNQLSGNTYLTKIVEALIFASSTPITAKSIVKLIADEIDSTEQDIHEAVSALRQNYANTAIDVVKVANGYRIQTREDFAPYVLKLFKEKPPRYSRALLETLALVIYQQPITRGEISEIRGVSVSSNVIHTLEERGWIEVVGQKEVPGRPALFGTTAELLDYLGISSIEALPPLPEMKDIAALPSESLMPLLKTLQQNENEDTDSLPNSDDISSASIEPRDKNNHTADRLTAADVETMPSVDGTTIETENAQTDIQIQDIEPEEGSGTVH
jgi:segregation and condensation protein B